MCCEFQLGKRDLYPSVGGTLNQSAHEENSNGNNRKFDSNQQVKLNGTHLDAFNWLMHLADGSLSNFQIAEKSGLDITVVNESIAAMCQENLVEL